MPAVYKRELYDDGTDMSMQQLGELNALDTKIRPKNRLLGSLLEEPKPFHETILPGPDPNNPHQIAPAPRPPAREQLRSILLR